MFHALRPDEGGFACSPLSEIRVPLGRQTFAARAEAEGRSDDDELSVECRSAPAPRRTRLGRRPAGSLP
jgi:hypothetical protein